MRFSNPLLIIILLVGCSSSKPNKDEIITRIGLITAKEDFDLNQVEKKSNVNTSIYGSISTGGRISIGLGFLLSPLFSGGSDKDPVRYEVELKDGVQITIYHESRDFEVDDCVKITSHPDEEKNPPIMKRSKDGCSP